MELSALLGRVVRGEAAEQVLDLYDRHRRPLNIEFVQQQTVANKKRMEEKDPAARAKNFRDLAAIAANPVSHGAYLMRASLLESVRRQPAD
jgi:3-(3-hydroxy-phenyl)propionate hydroxylase